MTRTTSLQVFDACHRIRTWHLFFAFFLSLSPFNFASGDELSWQNVYEVPRNETWEISWLNPYGKSTSGYDVRLISGKYSVQDPTLISPTRTARNEVHVVAYGNGIPAILYMHSGAVFQVGKKPFQFKVRMTRETVQNSIQTGSQINSKSSDSEGSLITITLGIGFLALVGLILFRLTRTPKASVTYRTSENESPPSSRPSREKKPTAETEVDREDDAKSLYGNRFKSKNGDFLSEEISGKTKTRIKDFQSPNSEAANRNASINQRIEKINQLLSDGLISEEEASEQRSRIMNEI